MKVLVKVKLDQFDDGIRQFELRGYRILDMFRPFSVLFLDVEDSEVLNEFNFIDHYEFEEEYELQSMNILPNIRVNKLKTRNFVGSNSIVGVIDSGMNVDTGLDIHQNVICSTSTSSSDSMINDQEHGTTVGKIIKYIAPWCRIVNLKVSNGAKKISKSAVIKALEYSLINEIKLINMSLGKKGVCDSKCIVCGIVNQMYDSGFAIVAAIGNYGREGVGITGCPGNAIKALTVGAVNANKQLAEYSSTASDGTLKPDILAPGTYIIDGKEFHGTSFAAPFITGTIAALADKFELHHIIDSIKKTAKGIGLSPNEQGHGLIHIESLMEVCTDEESAS